jgi:aspartyl-tRNA(Asn)/glutamyl-tRNA(Gln) amidotransferase subunit C
MKLDDVQRIAHLSSLELNQAEAEAVLPQLQAVFALVEEMQAVDTTGLEPLAHPILFLRDLAQPLRADVALIHSPRAGSRLAALVGERRATRIVAISAAAAAACGTGWAAIDVADVPNEHAMLACLARVCEAPLKNQMGRA